MVAEAFFAFAAVALIRICPEVEGSVQDHQPTESPAPRPVAWAGGTRKPGKNPCLPDRVNLTLIHSVAGGAGAGLIALGFPLFARYDNPANNPAGPTSRLTFSD